MNFQEKIHSNAFDNFKNHYLLLIDFTSMQDTTENCPHPRLIDQPLSLKLNFTFPLEHTTELKVLGQRMSSVAVDKFVVGKKI